jgi:hypothetical protein
LESALFLSYHPSSWESIRNGLARRLNIREKGEVRMAKKRAGLASDKLELYETLDATRPGVSRTGARVPFASVNRHMFGYLSTTGKLPLRHPTGVREAFLKKYKAVL